MFQQITHNNQIIWAQLRNGRLVSSKGYTLDVSCSWVAKATCPLICRHFLTETTNLLHPDKSFVCRYWYFPQTVTKPDLFCVPLGLRLNLVQCKSTSGKKPCGGGASVDEPAWDAALAPSVSSASSALLILERRLGTSTPSAFLFVIRKVFHSTHTTDFSRD